MQKIKNPISAVLVAALLANALAQPLRAFAQQGAGAKEYYSSNPSGRLLLTVQVWGDVPLPGRHFVPDNTSLLDLLGVAGGPMGSLEKTKVVLKRALPTDKSVPPKISEFQGSALLQAGVVDGLLVGNGDIIYVEVDKSEDSLMRGLSLASIVTGLISSILLTVFLINDRSK